MRALKLYSCGPSNHTHAGLKTLLMQGLETLLLAPVKSLSECVQLMSIVFSDIYTVL